MPLCILCGSEATEATAEDGSKLVSCPQCHCTLMEGLTKKPDWLEFRPKLAKAVRWWWFYKEEPTTLSSVILADGLVQSLEVFAEIRDDVGADALVNAGSFANPWHEPIIILGRAVGLPLNEARLFAKELMDRKIVEIVLAYLGRTLSPNEGFDGSFKQLQRWQRCKKKESAEAKGSG